MLKIIRNILKSNNGRNKIYQIDSIQSSRHQRSYEERNDLRYESEEKLYRFIQATGSRGTLFRPHINASFLSLSPLIDSSLKAVCIVASQLRCGPPYRWLPLFMVGQLIELVAPKAVGC